MIRTGPCQGSRGPDRGLINDVVPALADAGLKRALRRERAVPADGCCTETTRIVIGPNSRWRHQRAGRAVRRRAQRPRQSACGRRSKGTVGDDRSRHLDRRCRAARTARPLASGRRSAPWRAQCWLCWRGWRAARSGGCGETLSAELEQEAPDELVGGEGHCAVPRLAVAAVILVPEGDAAFVERNEPAVRDGDAMRVAG